MKFLQSFSPAFARGISKQAEIHVCIKCDLEDRVGKFARTNTLAVSRYVTKYWGSHKRSWTSSYNLASNGPDPWTKTHRLCLRPPPPLGGIEGPREEGSFSCYCMEEPWGDCPFEGGLVARYHHHYQPIVVTTKLRYHAILPYCP